MFSNLFQKIVEAVEGQADYQQKLQWFIERTNRHIELVKKAVEKLVNVYPEFKQLLQRAEVHDASKFEEPEKTPYIELSWRKKLEADGGQKLPSSEEEDQATLHHIITNPHHPEYHLKDKSELAVGNGDRETKECVDVSLMPDLDVAEMVSDWQAMSEELGTNTAREWFNKQKNVCWHFSSQQEQLIDKLLSVFE